MTTKTPTMAWMDFWQDSSEEGLIFFPEIDICVDPKVVSYPDQDNQQLGLDSQFDSDGLFSSLPCGDLASATFPRTIPPILQPPTPPLSSTCSRSPATDPGDPQLPCLERRSIGKHHASHLLSNHDSDDCNPPSSCETECTQEEVSQRIACSECDRDFANLRALDKHTQKTSHKAWRCSEPGCGKSYARRDTFLRHRAAHKENSHSCFACLREGREKVFKRKDHLREHMRSCHTKGSEGIRSVWPQFAMIPETTTN